MADPSPESLLIVGPCRQETGGVSQFLRGQADELGDHLDVTVYNTSVPAGSDALDAGGVAKGRWLVLAVLSALSRVLLFPLYLDADVVHVHASSRVSFYRKSIYILLVALLRDVPIVVHIHGSDFDDFLAEAGPVRRAYIQFIFDRCTEVIVLSEYWATVLEQELTLESVSVLPNPVRAEDFAPVYDVDPPRIVYVSNLIDRKGVEEFVTAARRLLDWSDLAFTVSIAGKGPRSDLVTDLATEFDAVEYHGFVSERRKLELLNEGSIYVLPTYAEGLPISLLEGMAGGNAIVSTTVGSIPEVVGPENGILVPPVDVDELCEAMESLVGDDDRRTAMARTNRATIEDEYTWDHITDQLLATYDRLVTGDDARPCRVTVDAQVTD
jgi:glycosyltransferase involved in cell wall biosynthesis